MKVTNWRRKLAASLVAGGILAPGAAYAQSLNTNLVVDPSFENVSVNTCCYGANQLNSWADGTQPGFAYAYSLGYDNGGPLAGGGNFYFTPNGDNDFMNGATDVTGPGQVSQNISVTSGAAATQIASGEAAVKLSAFFSGYLDNGDFGNLHVEFRNAGGNSLGSALISAPDTMTWNQGSGAAFIPVGTATLRASVFGTPRSGGPDGYMDLIDIQVTQAVNELLFLEVNTTTGQVAIKNQSGDPFHIDFYEIKVPPSPATGDYNNNGTVDAADQVLWRENLGQSVTLPNDSTPGTVTQADYDVWRANFGKGGGSANSLNATAWNSLQEQNLAGFPAGNGTGNGWEQAGGSDGGVLAEAYLTGNSLVSNGANISLGAAFNVGSPQNLEFRYGVVSDNGMGFVGPGVFNRGFVRYVTSGAGAAAAVPEPASVIFVGMGLASLALGTRGTKLKRT